MTLRFILIKQLFVIFLLILANTSAALAQPPDEPIPYSNASLGITLQAPPDFLWERGPRPEVVVIVRPKMGANPQMNIIRTKIYSRSVTGDTWSKIVEEDYKKIGILDVKIIEQKNLEIKTNGPAPFIVPAVDIYYSRAGEQFWSRVARISLSDSDLILTIKTNSQDMLLDSQLVQSLIQAITIDQEKIKYDEDSQANKLNTPLALIGLLLILFYILRRGIKRKNKIVAD